MMSDGGKSTSAAHFPGRSGIDSYGNGGFRFADMSHKGSLLFLPSGVWGWPVVNIADLSPAQFEQAFADAAELDFLILGTGADIALPGQDVIDAFAAKNIGLETMNTGAAARTYNVVLGEGRRVGAALIAVE